MGAFAGPEITETGLVLAIDAGNTKSYDKYENLYTYSENLATWNTDGVTTVTTDQTTSPNNDNTADKMVGPYVYRYFTSSGSPVPSGTTVTASVFVKNNGANTFNFVIYCLSASAFSSSVNLTTGTISGTGASIQAYPNGWYRISLTSTINSASCYLAIEGLGGSGASQSLYIWGAQVERSSTVSDYYSTTASTKSRGTTWTDLSGGGNTGTLTNGPTYSSANGGSIVFDGVDDYISIPNSTSINPGTGSFSIVTWVNSDPSNGGDGWDLWVAKRAPANGSNGYYLGVNNPLGAKFMVGNDANARTDTGYLTYTYNTWAMFTAILDRTANTQTVIKNNNIETSSVTPSGGNYSNTGALSIGGDIGINAYYVNGKVSYTQIYNRALTTAEVSQIYNATRGRYGI
jgi:hypothetical protein